MFSFFRKTEAFVAAASVPTEPVVSYKDRIQEVVSDAQEKIATIDASITKCKSERDSHYAELNPLVIRAAELQTAVEHANAVIAAAGGSNAQMESLLSIAESQLEDNLSKQKLLKIDIKTTTDFIERATEQMALAKQHLSAIQSDFSDLDLRETEASLRHDLSEITETFNEYRREVFVKEAEADLAEDPKLADRRRFSELTK